MTKPSFLRIADAADGSDNDAISASETWRIRVASSGQRKRSAMNSAHLSEVPSHAAASLRRTPERRTPRRRRYIGRRGADTSPTHRAGPRAAATEFSMKRLPQAAWSPYVSARLTLKNSKPPNLNEPWSR